MVELIVPLLFLLNNAFNTVDASLYIMFNVGACTAFYNVSYKTSYERNMSASILVLIGCTKTEFLLYAYSINMYCITLLLVTGKHPVKYVYIFPVFGFASPIAANTQLLFSSLLEKSLFPSPVLIAHFLFI